MLVVYLNNNTLNVSSHEILAFISQVRTEGRRSKQLLQALVAVMVVVVVVVALVMVVVPLHEVPLWGQFMRELQEGVANVMIMPDQGQVERVWVGLMKIMAALQMLEGVQSSILQ